MRAVIAHRLVSEQKQRAAVATPSNCEQVRFDCQSASLIQVLTVLSCDRTAGLNVYRYVSVAYQLLEVKKSVCTIYSVETVAPTCSSSDASWT